MKELSSQKLKFERKEVSKKEAYSYFESKGDEYKLELIENLKGRRNYEEKKASKLGFNSLYAYFENKLLQEKTALEESARELEITKNEEKLLKEEKSKPKKTCGCC